MNTMDFKIFRFTTLCLTLFIYSAEAQNYRYTSTLFPSSTITSNVVYGTANFLNGPYNDENNTSVGNLVMDIYRPQGDTCTNRPVILFAHGGGFFSGTRNNNDMAAFCDSFARMGYVTATFDYRMGVYTSSNSSLHYTRTVYRAIQDGRTAVRYFRANAAMYGIDPNKIYFAGSSAGAFIGLQSIYMDEPSEKPASANAITYTDIVAPFNFSGPDLGGYNIGDNLSLNGEPDAVLSLWGGVASTGLITVTNNQPVFLVHGTIDPIVPFDIGSPFSLPSLPNTYGSKQINLKLDSLGLTDKETYFVPNQGHEFYGVTNGMWNTGFGGNAYWDTVVNKSAIFFWKQHKPIANFNSSATQLNVNFTDNSSGSILWHWDFGDGNSSNLQNPNHAYATAGVYTVNLYIENNIQSWDTISHQITITATGIDKLKTNNFVVFPIPSKGLVYINFNYVLKNASVQLFNTLGQIIHEKSVQNNDQLTIDLSGLENNIYFIRIHTNEEISWIKVIKN